MVMVWFVVFKVATNWLRVTFNSARVKCGPGNRSPVTFRCWPDASPRSSTRRSTIPTSRRRRWINSPSCPPRRLSQATGSTSQTSITNTSTPTVTSSCSSMDNTRAYLCHRLPLRRILPPTPDSIQRRRFRGTKHPHIHDSHRKSTASLNAKWCGFLVSSTTLIIQVTCGTKWSLLGPTLALSLILSGTIPPKMIPVSGELQTEFAFKSFLINNNTNNHVCKYRPRPLSRRDGIRTIILVIGCHDFSDWNVKTVHPDNEGFF